MAKSKKKKITLIQKFRKSFVATVKAVTMREWFIVIWTVAKELFDLAQSLSLRDKVIVIAAALMEIYNWISNISDFVFGIQYGLLSFVVCVTGVFLAFPHIERTQRFLAAPALFIGLIVWASYLDFPTGPWLQGSVIGAFIAWAMAETKQFVDDFE